MRKSYGDVGEVILAAQQIHRAMAIDIGKKWVDELFS